MATATQLTSAQKLLAAYAAHTSQAIFVYETTLQDGFGEELFEDSQKNGDGQVFKMETRPGAGSALAGYLQTLLAPSTSSTPPPLSQLPVSALLSSPTLTHMIPSLLSLANKTSPRPSYALHVACGNALEEGGLEEGLGAVLSAAAQLNAFEGDEYPKTAVVFSHADGPEIFDVGSGLSTALSIAGYDLVHAFPSLVGGRDLAAFPSASSLTSKEVAESVEGALTLRTALSQALSSLNRAFFSYTGPESATHVLVVPLSASCAHASAGLSLLPANLQGQVGILGVRVLRPWSTRDFAAALPMGVKVLHVYNPTPGSEGSGALVEVILGTMASTWGPNKAPRVMPADVRNRDGDWTARDWARFWCSAVPALESPPATPIPFSTSSFPLPMPSLLPEGAKLCVFWGGDDAAPVLAGDLAKAFAAKKNNGVEARMGVSYDNYSQSGLACASLFLSSSPASSPMVVTGATAPSLVVVQQPQRVLKVYEPLAEENLSAETQVLVAAPGWTPEEYDAKFSPSTKVGLHRVFGSSDGEGKSGGGVWTLDVKLVGEKVGLEEGKVTEAGVWALYLGPAFSAALLRATGSFPSVDFDALAREVLAALNKVKIPAKWVKVKQEGECPAVETVRARGEVLERGLPLQGPGTDSGDQIHLCEDQRKALGPVPEEKEETKPTRIGANAMGPLRKAWKRIENPPAREVGWKDAAKALMFGEAYGTVSDDGKGGGAKRPDLPEENYVVEVTENRRLTPTEYDRNVFHMELSTKGTGLKYAVGEALGVHGWNDEEEVKEFIAWYGLDPEALVEVPARNDPKAKREIRTVFQAFQQNLDVFGKPPKQFYEELSKVAKDKAEKDHLHFIASAEGSWTYRKWSETDTVTFADVFRAFPSARFELADLVEKIGLIKPRHYSIASSQHFVGDLVHLLVVTVDWRTPSGKVRYGQCTRYLSGLKKGAKVMVSVKPSVMKLPPREEQPIVMAGLGTGAAPFRAFIQERAWLRAQGGKAGPLVYYFGSRHRSKEYLYGEELEAYLQDGIVTHAGLAFSRDGPQKVYIQHKMDEGAAMLADYFHDQDGVFYLCGPTWPVPDVHRSICKALQNNKGLTLKGAEDYVADMKEHERVVLEVY